MDFPKSEQEGQLVSKNLESFSGSTTLAYLTFVNLCISYHLKCQAVNELKHFLAEKLSLLWLCKSYLIL